MNDSLIDPVFRWMSPRGNLLRACFVVACIIGWLLTLRSPPSPIVLLNYACLGLAVEAICRPALRGRLARRTALSLAAIARFAAVFVYAPFDGYVSHWAEAWDSKKSDWVQTEQPISPWHAKDRLLDFRDSYSRWRGQPCFREMAEYDRKVSDCYPRWEAEGPMIGRLKQHGEWQLTVDPCGAERHVSYD